MEGVKYPDVKGLPEHQRLAILSAQAACAKYEHQVAQTKKAKVSREDALVRARMDADVPWNVLAYYVGLSRARVAQIVSTSVARTTVQDELEGVGE